MLYYNIIYFYSYVIIRSYTFLKYLLVNLINMSMHSTIFFFTLFLSSFILYGLLYIIEQDAIAFDDNYEINFAAYMDPDELVLDDDYGHKYTFNDHNSQGLVYLTFDPSFNKLYYQVFLEGMSYVAGDDVEIIQIHLGEQGENGPTVLSLCDEKSKEGHCREGPGLSVEGVLTDKDLKGPLKDSSLTELIRLFEADESYVYVQSRAHPEGEIRGQILSFNNNIFPLEAEDFEDLPSSSSSTSSEPLPPPTQLPQKSLNSKLLPSPQSSSPLNTFDMPSISNEDLQRIPLPPIPSLKF
jgi:CHRD domain